MAFMPFQRCIGDRRLKSKRTRLGAVPEFRTHTRSLVRLWPISLFDLGLGINNVMPSYCQTRGPAAAVAAGAPSVAKPLQLGGLQLQTPLVLAPMAGITNAPFRLQCARHGAELCVSELIIASTLLQRTPAALQLARWAPGMTLIFPAVYQYLPDDAVTHVSLNTVADVFPKLHVIVIQPSQFTDSYRFIWSPSERFHHLWVTSDVLCAEERVRSAQLYASRPEDMHQATAALVQDFGVSHVDINFGCPVRKITSRGGGAAIPLKPELFTSLVRAAVAGAHGVPVTVKMRLGVSPDMETFLEAGRIADLEGAAAVVLHARYAEQLYAPPVHWQGIADLAKQLQVPVIGNGDVFTARDALQMLSTTGAQGVMIGRACLGRPWVFAEVAAAMRGEAAPPRPRLQDAVREMQEHAHGLAEWEGSEHKAVLQMRKFVRLYLHGFQSAGELQSALMQCQDLATWDQALQAHPYSVDEYAAGASDVLPRLKGGPQGATKRVVLPDGWLDPDYDVSNITDVACEG